MFIARFIYTFILLLTLTCTTQAFWEDGHAIVAKIAEMYLSADARAGVKDLLGDGTEGERAISDVRICTWADLIRGSGQLNRKYPKNDTWHYINIELKDKEGEFKIPADGNHVIGAIERFKKVLKDPQADKQDRKEALMFVVHFLGDMHQPMHTGNRENDRGGNLQLIKSVLGKTEEKLNLHKVWDGHLVKGVRGELTNDDFVKRLVDEIKDEHREKWTKGDTTQWVWESHAIVVDRVYKFTDGTPLPKRSDPPVELTEENYMKENRPYVREQLKKGGVRLAKVLNECFEVKK
ncbi:MAG: S1/P1 nuclease [Planctomycetes bacterium]|nr:S1/P1 nuclease [Planctomycetota bacterium]